MPIVSELGIYTAELCTDSKKYLSRLLVGKTGIDSNCITWDLLLTEKLNLDAFIETDKEIHEAELLKARDEWNRLLKENQLKTVIENKLIEIETNYLPERLKAYDPEVKKQEEDLRHKKRALISIAIIIGLAIAFPLVLSLLGGAAMLIGVASLAVGATLLCGSVIPAFFGERLIEPEWNKEYSREKNIWRRKIAEIKATSPLTIEMATQTTSDESIMDKPPINYNISFFIPAKSSIDPEQEAIVQRDITI